jgi:hypothetical protein
MNGNEGYGTFHFLKKGMTVVTSGTHLMIPASAIGMYLFCVTVENVRNERKIREERDTLLKEKER